MNQKTLKASFTLQGKGLHSGIEIKATFNPAPANHGYKFRRVDLEGQPVIDALAENVVDTARGTVLARGDVRVSTVEHALAALFASGVDNCLIDVDGPEVPILDGSGMRFIEEIEKVGLEEQDHDKDYYYIREKTLLQDPATGSCITIYPDDNFSVETMVEYNSAVLPNQFAVLDDLSEFKTEVAGARTFVFVREIEQLLKYGLIKGGDLDNAIVIYDRETSQENINEICDLMQMPHMHLDRPARQAPPLLGHSGNRRQKPAD